MGTISHRPRVVLADDHRVVLEALGKLLESEFDLVGVAEDGTAILSMVEELRPDLVLLDISMPQLSGLEVARRLRQKTPHVKILFVTMHDDATYVDEALRAGASGYVVKQCGAEDLLRGIREVLQGRTYVSRILAGRWEDSERRSSRTSATPARALSLRQQEVLRLLAHGMSAKDIAARLEISVKTVGFHKSAITRKLGLDSTAELTRYAIAHGLIQL